MLLIRPSPLDSCYSFICAKCSPEKKAEFKHMHKRWHASPLLAVVLHVDLMCRCARVDVACTALFNMERLFNREIFSLQDELMPFLERHWSDFGSQRDRPLLASTSSTSSSPLSWLISVC